MISPGSFNYSIQIFHKKSLKSGAAEKVIDPFSLLASLNYYAKPRLDIWNIQVSYSLRVLLADNEFQKILKC